MAQVRLFVYFHRQVKSLKMAATIYERDNFVAVVQLSTIHKRTWASLMLIALFNATQLPQRPAKIAKNLSIIF